jgi:RimJ/RimL family protein N-acetyltransferase
VKTHPLHIGELTGRYAKLVPLQMLHADALLEAANISRKTYRYTLVPHDLASAIAYVERALSLKEKGEALPFATLEKSSDRVIGTTRFMSMEYWSWPEESPFKRETGIPDVVEIGATWLAEPFQRSGINTDAKLLMLTHAFDEWKVHRLSLKTDARNEKSRKNIERLGAKFDGILRAHMPAFDGEIRDTAFYSILKSDWPNVRRQLLARLK